MLSIREIAKRTQLSTATVSRALNPATAEKVKPETRNRILALCDEAKFRPDSNARCFSTGNTYKIAFISGRVSMDLGFQLSALSWEAICDELQKNGYNFLVLGTHNDEKMDGNVINFLRSNVADAYIMGSSIVSKSVLEAILDCGRPVLTIENILGEDTPLNLSRDIEPAYKEIWQRIPDSFRNEDIVYCVEQKDVNKYHCACASAPQGRKLNSHIISLPIVTHAFYRSLAAEALKKDIELFKTKKLIWCCSDLMAFGVMELMSGCGRELGKDYFLIGYDNLEGINNYGDNAVLSTLDGMNYEYGVMAVKMILRAIKEPYSEHVKFPFKYISRKSFPF